MKNKAITSRDVDYGKWYTDIVMAAKLASYSNVKGCIVIEPNGYAIWEMMMKILDAKFKETGHQNVSMPLLIPENLINKESELIQGFAPEVAWVTIGGQKQLEERLCIRPTSETLFSDYYSGVIESYRDLPKKYNQWCNILRWEKETRPFLRSREFLWQEGHTVHETSSEAEEETKKMLEIYKDFYENYMAIPALTGLKTESEKFAGAEYTYTVEALMYNGYSLQGGTSHYFGNKFSKAYDIKFLNRNNVREYAYQTSWGVSTRMIGALIMVHGDDRGLVLPPKIAPYQVVIIALGNDEEVEKVCYKLNAELNQNNIRSYIDNTDKSAGFKFAEAEVKGIPIRIEVGSRDLKNNVLTIVRRDNYEKEIIDINTDITNYVVNLCNTIQKDMFNKAKQRNDTKTFTCNTIEEVKTIMNSNPGYIKALWCGDYNCELKMKEIRGTKSRCIKDEEFKEGKCVVCGKDAKHMVYWGIQY
ncbi:MAG: proline--tRNA ligase [bacterium]|nr:proline--tRNA ligase [bacterium]